jgi:hypothetical protein
MIHWTKTSDELPRLNELLWLRQQNCIFLGERYATAETWLWAVHVGSLHFEDAKVVSDECEPDDVSPDEWAYVN